MAQSIKIADGVAENMGDGVVIVCQPSDKGPQNVVLTTDDLRGLLAALEG